MAGPKYLPAMLASIALCALVSVQPDFNFDCVLYAAAARQFLGENPHDVHLQTYRDLERVAPQDARYAIARGSEYRTTLSTDVAALRIQLPFYENKPLYVAIVAALVAAGANSIKATFWVSAVAYGAFAAALLISIRRISTRNVASAVVLCLLLSPQFTEIGRLATPDSLAAALSFAGVACVVLWSHQALAIVFLIAAVLARPDSIFFCLTPLTWQYATGRATQAAVVRSAGVSFACLIAAYRPGSYSYAAIMTHTFKRRILTVGDLSTANVTTSDYLSILARGFGQNFILHPSVVLPFCIISLLAVLRSSKKHHDELVLLMIIWGSIVLHFLVFPMLADRFFVAQYAFTTLISIAILDDGAILANARQG